MLAKKFNKVVNGYRISWSEKHQEYRIRHNGKLIGKAYLLSVAVEACKSLPKAS